jgi:hypothetical protein
MFFLLCNICKDTGFDTLLEFLDKHLADSLEKFEEFEDLKRAEGQTINEYIAVFDRQKDKTQVKQLRQSSPITYISKYTIEHNNI